ncbi:hypothetical protein J6590_054288 [Homalodisca vitripennis]|nr:hypothetical protein J6590_054288 [Homalodisca vitripennis]
MKTNHQFGKLRTGLASPDRTSLSPNILTPTADRTYIHQSFVPISPLIRLILLEDSFRFGI